MSDVLTFAPQFRIASLGGITIVTCAGWDGAVEIIPRDQIASHLTSQHADRVGTYVLLGTDEDQPYAYVGSGALAARLTRHLGDGSKGSFSRVAILYAPSGWLTNSRAAHLEALLYRTACAVGQVRLLNGVSPTEPRLDGPGDTAALQFWTRVALNAMKLVGLGILIERLPSVYTPLRPPCGCSTQEEVFRLAAAYDATLVVRGDRLLVRAGSRGRAAEGERWAAERGTGYTRRRELIDAGLLAPLGDGEFLMAAADIPVRSPSEASCMLSTQENSGRSAWRHVATGRPFGEFYADREEGWANDDQ